MHIVLDMHVHRMHIWQMDLAEWMQKKNLADADLAIQVERDRTTVSRWRTKKTKPDFDALVAIEKLTGGKVTAKDFAA